MAVSEARENKIRKNRKEEGGKETNMNDGKEYDRG